MVRTQYGTGDTNGGPTNYYFSGTATGKSDLVNVNAGLPYQQVVSANTLNQQYYSETTRKAIVDGNLVSNDESNIFWKLGEFKDSDLNNTIPGEHALTILYTGNPQDVGSIGLAMSGNANRPAPKWITVSGYNSATDTWYEDVLDFANNPEWAWQIQYNRYDLPRDYLGIDWLKITFPPSSTDKERADNWWIPGTDWNFGVVEFQAFQVVVPEPATMTLLALSGVALLRRRGR